MQVFFGIHYFANLCCLSNVDLQILTRQDMKY